VKLVDFGNDGQYAGGDDSESELSFQPASQAWNTLEIPLTQFTNLNSLSHFAQLILSGEPVGTGVVFIDNILFFNENLSSVETLNLVDLQVFPNPAKGIIHIRSAQEMRMLQMMNTQGQCLLEKEMNSNQSIIDIQHLVPGMYWLSIEMADGSQGKLEPIVID
jgi:hypothetical protein